MVLGCNRHPILHFQRSISLNLDIVFAWIPHVAIDPVILTVNPMEPIQLSWYILHRRPIIANNTVNFATIRHQRVKNP